MHGIEHADDSSASIRPTTGIRRLLMLVGSALTVSGIVIALQVTISSAYASGVSPVCDLCSTSFNPVACCQSGGEATDTNPGGGIDVSAQKAAFDSYCNDYKAKQKAATDKAAADKAAADKAAADKAAADAAAAQSSSSNSGSSASGSNAGSNSSSGASSSKAAASGTGAVGDNATQKDSQGTQDADKNSDDETDETDETDESDEDDESDDDDTTDIDDLDESDAEDSTAVSAANDSQSSESNPAVRIGAGIVLALAVVAAAVAAVIFKRRQSVPVTQDGEAALSDAGQNPPATDLDSFGSQTDAASPPNSLAALSASVPDSQTLVLPEYGELTERDVGQSGAVLPQLESGLDAHSDFVDGENSEGTQPQRHDATATAVIDQHEHNGNENTSLDDDAKPFLFEVK